VAPAVLPERSTIDPARLLRQTAPAQPAGASDGRSKVMRSACCAGASAASRASEVASHVQVTAQRREPCPAVLTFADDSKAGGVARAARVPRRLVEQHVEGRSGRRPWCRVLQRHVGSWQGERWRSGPQAAALSLSHGVGFATRVRRSEHVAPAERRGARDISSSRFVREGWYRCSRNDKEPTFACPSYCSSHWTTRSSFQRWT
jgi:hypothetical protein